MKKQKFIKSLGIVLNCFIIVINQGATNIYALGRNNSGFSDAVLEEIKNGNVNGHRLFYLSPNIDMNVETEVINDMNRINWNSDDWDNDGIKNKQEIKITKGKLGYSYEIASNPLYNNSDFDMYLDGQEEKGNASPIRYSFSEEDFNNLFMEHVTDDIVKNILLNVNMKVADWTFGENEKEVFENTLKEFITSSIEDKSIFEEIAQYSDNYYGNIYDGFKSSSEAFGLISESAKITTNESEVLGYITLAIDAIKQGFSDFIISDYKDRLKYYDDILDNLSKDAFYKKGKEATKAVKKLLNDNKCKNAVLSVATKIGEEIIKSKGIDLLTSTIPLIKEIKVGSEVGIFIIKETSEINEDYEKALKCITYVSLIRAIGTEIKKYCDANNVKVSIDSNKKEKVYTIKKGKVKYVMELFKDYIRAISFLIDNYEIESKIALLLCSKYKKPDKESIISSLKTIEKRMGISLYYDSNSLSELNSKNVNEKLNKVDINKYIKDTNRDGWVGDKYYKGGYMVINEWIEEDGKWYYLSDDGHVIKNCWYNVGGNWYYFDVGGRMATSKWIDGTYYVDENGLMLKNTMTPDGYMVDENGRYIDQILQELLANYVAIKSDKRTNVSISRYYGSYIDANYLHDCKMDADGNLYEYEKTSYAIDSVGRMNVDEILTVKDRRGNIVKYNYGGEMAAEWFYINGEYASKDKVVSEFNKYENMNDMYANFASQANINDSNMNNSANSIQNLLDYYDKFNSENGASKSSDGSYWVQMDIVTSSMAKNTGLVTQTPAIFDSAGNLWCCRHESSGFRGDGTYYLVIKYLNGEDSREYTKTREDQLRYWNISYDSSESENMFKTYEEMKDEYLKFKQ